MIRTYVCLLFSIHDAAFVRAAVAVFVMANMYHFSPSVEPSTIHFTLIPPLRMLKYVSLVFVQTNQNITLFDQRYRDC